MSVPMPNPTLKKIKTLLCGPRKLHFAVIGFPSSGKSYLLADLVTAFEEMGYKQEVLPLSYPHSSLGSFFHDLNDDSGRTTKTDVYACRPENHYGAHLYKEETNEHIELDFLNIPGEAFKDPKLKLDAFFQLVRSLEKVPKGIFDLTFWRNPSGQERILLEPNKEHWNEYMTESRETLTIWRGFIDDDKRENSYLNFKEIFHDLYTGRFELKSRKAVTGKELLKRFFDILPDSICETFWYTWKALSTDNDRAEFFVNRGLQYFYFFHYCKSASDIILCDKLFQGDGTPTENDAFGDLCDFFANFMNQMSGDKPKVYLAFRGTDFFLKKKEGNYKHLLRDLPPEKRRATAYGTFIQQMSKMLKNKSGDEDYNRYLDDQGGRKDDLVWKINSRFGGNISNAFWKLLYTSSLRHGWRGLLQRIRKEEDIQTIWQQKASPIPPHVYFTATPIDLDFNVYVNDPEEATRFVYDGRSHAIPGERCYRTFHVETSKYGARQFCFGSYQLLQDILC